MVRQCFNCLQSTLRIHFHIRCCTGKTAGSCDDCLESSGMLSCKSSFLCLPQKIDDPILCLRILHGIEYRERQDSFPEIHLRELAFLLRVGNKIQQVIADLEHIAKIDPQLFELCLHVFTASAFHCARQTGQSAQGSCLAVNIVHILLYRDVFSAAALHLPQFSQTHRLNSLAEKSAHTIKAVPEQALDDPAEDQVARIDSHILAVFGLCCRKSAAKRRIVDNIVMNKRCHVDKLHQGSQAAEFLSPAGLLPVSVPAGHQ